MCGFAGERAFGRAADADAVQRMADTMRSRGPDGAGHWAHDGVALAHRRLNIIDLSSTGDQPMTDPEVGLTVAFDAREMVVNSSQNGGGKDTCVIDP